MGRDVGFHVDIQTKHIDNISNSSYKIDRINTIYEYFVRMLYYSRTFVNVSSITFIYIGGPVKSTNIIV